MSQKLVLATAAIILSSFPIHKPLAEDPPKKPAMSEPLNLGTIKVDLSKCDTSSPVPSCKQGRRILVSVTDAEGKTLTDAKIKITKPDGSSFIAVNDGIQNFVLLDSPGEYAFEYQNKTFVIFVERSASPVVNELGILKLSTNSCKLGETVWVDVVNSDAKQITGETVKVVSPSGKETEVKISNELNGFVLDEFGHYKFIYSSQERIVCVKPFNEKIQVISLSMLKDLLNRRQNYVFPSIPGKEEKVVRTLEEEQARRMFFKIALEVGFSQNTVLNPDYSTRKICINTFKEEIGISFEDFVALYADCRSACEPFLVQRWCALRGVDTSDDFRNLSSLADKFSKGPVLYIQHRKGYSTDYFLVNLDDFFADFGGFANMLSFDGKVVAFASSENTLLFLVASPLDGSFGAISEISEDRKTITTRFVYVHDDSICPFNSFLSTDPVK
jgi:hypothetical protein